MREFSLTISDEAGVHARPAGMLVKKMQTFESEVSLTCGGRTINCKKLFALMGLGIRKGETITISAHGPDEAQAIAAAQFVLEETMS